jgi:hypothetical protein
LPVAALAVAGVLFAEGAMLAVIWMHAQFGSLLVTGLVALTGIQGACVLFTLLPLRFFRVFGAAGPDV